MRAFAVRGLDVDDKVIFLDGQTGGYAYLTTVRELSDFLISENIELVNNEEHLGIITKEEKEEDLKEWSNPSKEKRISIILNHEYYPKVPDQELIAKWEEFTGSTWE